MTISTELLAFAVAYRDYARAINTAGDIDVATRYAMQDLMHLLRGNVLEYQMHIIQDEILDLKTKTANKLAHDRRLKQKK